MKHLPLLLTSVIFGIVAFFWLYPYHFALPYFDTDFVDYCVGVATLDDLHRHFPPKRSRLVGVLPWIWRDHYGVLHGLSIASTISMVGVGVILSTWAERIKPRCGWYTLAVLMACSPWIGSGRFLNFYPEIMLGLSISSFLVWLGLDSRTSRTEWGRGILFGSGIGLAALVDARGLIWGGWFMAVGVCWMLYKQPFINILQRFIGITVAVVTSWYLGQWAYGPQSTSLIRQLDVQPLRYALSLPNAQPPPYDLPDEFIWGHNFASIWENVSFVLHQQTLGLPTSAPSDYWVCWLILIGISLLLTARNYWRYWTIAFPFVVVYLQIGHAVENHVRFYMQSLPPLMIGLALSLSLMTQRLSSKWHVTTVAGLTLLLPYLSLILGPHWTIEREISHKMLLQAHPEDHNLRHQNTLFGSPIHIQTLPVTQQERQITQDWDMLCTDALRNHSPILWFEKE